MLWISSSSKAEVEIEELRDRSGATRYGYADPPDMAEEMFEEAIESFLEELRKYQDISMTNQALFYCMGILKGIYRFDRESQTEFRDWATDAPSEFFHIILEEWKKGCKNPDDLKIMEDFIESNCPKCSR